MSRLILCMIVKNEHHVILRCLSQIHKYISYWIILDTGSTDGTQQLIKDFFEGVDIPGELHQDTWYDDFGYSRSKVLGLCEGKGDYAWMFDADDTIHGDLIIPTLLTADCYALYFNKDNKYARHSIFKLGLGWRYKYVLHEQPHNDVKREVQVISGDYYINSGRDGARNHVEDKYLRDAAIIEKELDKVYTWTNEKEKKEALDHYIYYLAQSYFDAYDFEKALYFYKERTKLGKDPRITQCYMRIHECQKRLGIDPDEIIMWLENGRIYSPEKIEFGYSLADWYIKIDRFDDAIKVLESYVDVIRPPDLMMYNSDVYTYGLWTKLANLYIDIDITKAYDTFVRLLKRYVSKEMVIPISKRLDVVKTKCRLYTFRHSPLFNPKWLHKDKFKRELVFQLEHRHNMKLKKKISCYLVGPWNWTCWNSLANIEDLYIVDKIVHLSLFKEHQPLPIKSIKVSSIDKLLASIKDPYIVIPTHFVIADKRQYIIPSLSIFSVSPARTIRFNLLKHNDILYTPNGVGYTKTDFIPDMPYIYLDNKGDHLCWYDVTCYKIPFIYQSLDSKWLCLPFKLGNKLYTMDNKQWKNLIEAVRLNAEAAGFTTDGCIHDAEPSVEASTEKTILQRCRLNWSLETWQAIAKKCNTCISMMMIERILIHTITNYVQFKRWYWMNNWLDVRVYNSISDPQHSSVDKITLIHSDNVVVDFSQLYKVDAYIYQSDWYRINLGKNGYIIRLITPDRTKIYDLDIMIDV